MNNRTLKFRVWDIDGKIWINVDDIIIDGDGILWIRDWINDCVTRKGNFVIQQFTGLLDKNNKEIFEGDIVTFQQNSSCHGKYGNETGIVKSSKYGEWIIENLNKNRWPKETIFDNLFTCKKSEREEEVIIGNIFQNPELLATA